MRQIAQAADDLGYEGVLLPTGVSCEDAWVVASSMIPLTKRLKFLVAIRPGLMSPSLAARMAATFDRLSDGRLLINVVTGGDPVELAGDGLHARSRRALRHHRRVPHRLAQASWPARRSISRGSYLDIRGGKLLIPGVQKPHPPLYFGGSSPAAQQVAAKHVDLYLTWGEPPDQVAEKIASVRRLAEAEGRHDALRHPPARHRARNRGGGLARRGDADQPRRRSDDRPRAAASSPAWTRTVSRA